MLRAYVQVGMFQLSRIVSRYNASVIHFIMLLHAEFCTASRKHFDTIFIEIFMCLSVDTCRRRKIRNIDMSTSKNHADATPKNLGKLTLSWVSSIFCPQAY